MIDQIVDDYLRSVSEKPAQIWQQADRHAEHVATLVPKHAMVDALEQLLKHRIRDRLASVSR